MAIDTQITDIMSVLNERSALPSWALGDDATIVKANDTDENYVRKRIYDASGPNKRKLTIWGYDGNDHVFRSHFTLIASSDMLGEIGKAMGKLQPQCRAFLVRATDTDMVLFWLDGHPLPKPVLLPATSGRNPDQDWKLMNALTAKLDGISNSEEHTGVRSMKAWVNANTGEIRAFEPKIGFDAYLAKAAANFNVQGQDNVLKARIAVEQKGWVACGVNATNQSKIVAVVQGLTDEAAETAARHFAGRASGGEWSVLKIRTNQSSRDIVGKDKIAEFLKTHYV